MDDERLSGAASIREVYNLIDSRTSSIQQSINALSIRIEGIETRFQAHAQLDAHPGTAMQLRKINTTLAKYAGGLGVLTFLIGLFIKFV